MKPTTLSAPVKAREAPLLPLNFLKKYFSLWVVSSLAFRLDSGDGVKGRSLWLKSFFNVRHFFSNLDAGDVGVEVYFTDQ